MLGALDSAEKEFVASIFEAPISDLSPQDMLCEGLSLLVRSAKDSGSDIRVADNSLLSPASWPRQGLNTDHFDWKVVLSVH